MQAAWPTADRKTRRALPRRLLMNCDGCGHSSRENHSGVVAPSQPNCGRAKGTAEPMSPTPDRNTIPPQALRSDAARLRRVWPEVERNPNPRRRPRLNKLRMVLGQCRHENHVPRAAPFATEIESILANVSSQTRAAKPSHSQHQQPGLPVEPRKPTSHRQPGYDQTTTTRRP